MPPSRFAKESVAARKIKDEPITPAAEVKENVEPNSLQITVTNFRCWLGTHSWTLPRQQGLVLIQAPSGQGKSSILSAINWVLSGKVAINSCSWDKKRMTAELSWFPHHPSLHPPLRSIFRCNTPRQFKLTFVDGRVIDGAEAEAYLSEQVGIPYPLIGQLSQLSQKLMGVHTHLMQLPQADKSVFLQQLFVPDPNHKELVSQLRSFCKDEVKTAQSELSASSAKVQQGQSMIDELSEVLDGVELVERVQERLDELDRVRGRWQTQVARERQYSYAIEHLRSIFESESCSDYARGLLVSFSEWIADWYAPDVQAEIDQLLEDCTLISLEHRHTVHEIEYERALQSELQGRRQAVVRAQQVVDELRCKACTEAALDALEQNVARLNVQICEQQNATRRLNQHVNAHGTMDVLVERLQSVEDSRSLSLICPSCSTGIAYSVEQQAWVIDAGSGAPSTVVDTQSQLQREAERIRDKRRWDMVLAERRQLQSLAGSVAIDVTQLERSLQQQRAMLDQHRRDRALLASAETTVRTCTAALDGPLSAAVRAASVMERDQCLPVTDRVEARLHREAAELYARLAREIGALSVVTRVPGQQVWTPALEEELNRLQTQLGHERTRVKLAQWREQIDRHRSNVEQASTRLEAAHTLERLGRDAELRTLQQHLLSLNAVLQQLLDEVMFREGGEMQCSFEVSTTSVKPEVEMRLYQRGQLCDERSLSGGEYDRLALAVSLALYRLFAAKVGLLCLDESLSSLDAEVANGILMRLHEGASVGVGLMIMVDHHGGGGMFDHVVAL